MLRNMFTKDGGTLTLQREELLKPLSLVAGVIERRQTIPILSHVVVAVDKSGMLTVLASDSEIEIQGCAELAPDTKSFGPITLPGKKLLDICRSLPDNSKVEINAENLERVVVKAGRSRFTLAALAADEFPVIPAQKSVVEFPIAQKILKSLVTKTYFAIPQQETRQYLHGMLLEIKDGTVRTVASDAYRLAMSTAQFADKNAAFAQVILPRKGVLELARLLTDVGDAVVGINSNYMRVSSTEFVFTSKLIAGRYPNYSALIPRRNEQPLILDRQEFKQALQRVSVLSDEMLRQFVLFLEDGTLKLSAQNPEHEDAAEELAVDYAGKNLEIVFGISYMLDILNSIEAEQILVTLKDSNTGALVESGDSNENCLFVLMPVRN